MKPSWRAADQAAEIQASARAWNAAGLIDAAALEALASRAPGTTGPHVGWPWRALIFLCVAVGVLSLTGLGLFTSGLRDESGVAALLLCIGAVLAIATEVVVGRLAFRPSGAEAATSLLAACHLAAGVYLAADGWHLGGRLETGIGLGATAGFFGLAAWRWGFRLYAGVAALFALLLAAQFPGPRLAWTAAAGALAAGASLALARREFAPSHRDGLALARLVALAGLYVAVNYYAVDHRVIGELGRQVGEPHGRTGDTARLLALAGTVLLPPAILAWGLRTRERTLIDLGIAAAALSLVTLRFYVHVAPLWVVLAGSGAALTGVALLIEHWLKAGAGGERFGFTAAPLYDERLRERLLPLAAAIALAPAARSIQQPPRGVEGGGGGFGGGGAAGTL